jgi:hypothetical protein
LWPRPRIDDNAAGHVIPAGADSAYTAINRLLADDVPVRRLAGNSGTVGKGDIYLSAKDLKLSKLRGISEELHLPVFPVAEEPKTKMWRVGASRVGLFKPWVASMDEGWTRFVLENYEFPLVSLSNEKIRSGEFASTVDVLLFPDINPSIIARGKPEKGSRYARYFSPLPPKYSGGIDEWSRDGETKETDRVKGGKRIKQWVENGGTVVALDSSTEYVIDLFELPVSNALEKDSRSEFNCPGSTLRVLMNPESPLSLGMRPEEAIYFGNSPAFQTRVPDARFDRAVVARYPDNEKDILISGYLEGGELLERKAAVVEFRVGKGRVILIGFHPQHRAQPLRTFKLLFNALYVVE